MTLMNLTKDSVEGWGDGARLQEEVKSGDEAKAAFCENKWSGSLSINGTR